MRISGEIERSKGGLEESLVDVPNIFLYVEIMSPNCLNCIFIYFHDRGIK